MSAPSARARLGDRRLVQRRGRVHHPRRQWQRRGGDKQAIANNVANPLYVVAGQQVNHVLGVATTGVAGYNPYWYLVFVTVNSDRDLATDPFISEAEILAAMAIGEVSLNDTGFVLLCQVVAP